MTRTELVAQIMALLGFRTDARTEQQVLAQIPIQQRRLENGATKPWWLLSEYVTLNTVIGEQAIALPSDFISEHEEDGLSVWVEDENRFRSLIKSDLDQLNENYRDTTGIPEAYALVGDFFRVFPLPDAEYDLRMLYYVKEPALSVGASENKFTIEQPELLMAAVGLRVAQALRDQAAQVTFRDMGTEARVEMFRQNELRSHANARYQIGGQH